MGDEHHQVGSVPLRTELVLWLQVFRCIWSLGQKGWRAGRWVWAAPGHHGFSYFEGALELFHFEGAKVSLFSRLVGEVLPYMSSKALNFNLALGANGMRSRE